jgi:hypothetical protein
LANVTTPVTPLGAARGFEVIRLMRRELAELTEMMSHGAGIPGDEQRIDMIKGLLARWHKKVPVIICIEAGAAGMVRGDAGAGFSIACCNVDAVTRAGRRTKSQSLRLNL